MPPNKRSNEKQSKAKKPSKPRPQIQLSSTKTGHDSLSNAEVVVIAALGAGAASAHVDTEDIAVKANEISPGRFTWKKFPEQIDIDAVRKRLWDAMRDGHLMGSERNGWLLTERGVAFARENGHLSRSAKSARLSLNERTWRRAEKGRLLSTNAYSKFIASNSAAITVREAQGFFRIDAYVSRSSIEEKILRIVNAFSEDQELGAAVKYIASIVRGSNVVESHLR